MDDERGRKTVMELVKLHKLRPINPQLMGYLENVQSVSDPIFEHFGNGLLQNTLAEFSQNTVQLLPIHLNENPLLQLIAKTNTWPSNRMSISSPNGWMWGQDSEGNDLQEKENYNFTLQNAIIVDNGSLQSKMLRIPNQGRPHYLEGLRLVG